ncbi:MAG TPA: hypothetical protein VEW48_16820 [Thermoanaerobaculia bacterium]|nr:hypothetical protein [Thermoanaerobaculia bacterium]
MRAQCSSPGIRPVWVVHRLNPLLLLLLLSLPLLSCQKPGAIAQHGADPASVRIEPLPPTDIVFPNSLGKVKDRFAGSPGRTTIFVIGENHGALDVQQKVADILAYLRAAYGVKLVCIEGMKGPLTIPAGLALPARQMAAEADFLARRINAVELFALSYPDVRVIGVDDMQAYAEHGEELSRTPPGAAEWEHSYQEFLRTDVEALPEEQVARIEEAFENSKDFEELAEKLQKIIDPNSATGQKFAELLAKRAQILAPEKALMNRRDKAMADATFEAAAVGHVALVVGSLHLEGIGRNLRGSGIPFVSILAAGAEDTPSADDLASYNRLNKGESGPLEAWLHHAPQPQLQRESMRNKVTLMGALFHADRLLQHGDSEDHVRAVMSGVSVQIVGTYPIPGGYGIEFVVNGRRGHAYFSSQELPEFTDTNRRDRLETGSAGGRHYGIFDGGGKPPDLPSLPPVAPAGGEPPDFGGRLVGALNDQERKRPHAVTVALFEEDGTLVLQVERHKRLLGLSLKELRHLVEAYWNAGETAEAIVAAQRIAEKLLREIDQDLPPERIVLYQISQDDLLGNLSLPAIAALASIPGTSRLTEMEEVYTVPWEGGRPNLDQLHQVPALVDINTTVFWIGAGLESDPGHAATIEAIRSAGVRLNEPLRPGDTVVLLGSGTGGWKAVLTDGSRVSAQSKALLKAGAIVSLGVAVPKKTSARTTFLDLSEMSAERSLGFGRELARDIRKDSGKETLDRVVRKRSLAERAEATRRLSRRSFEKASTLAAARWQVDTRATVLSST